MTNTPIDSQLARLASLLVYHETDDNNIWTIRLSPSKQEYTVPKACKPYGALTNHEELYPRDVFIRLMFKSLGCYCPHYVVYGESSKKSKETDHYHARIVHQKWGTVANLYRWIRAWFPNEHGNALFSTKKVWVNKKSYSHRAKSLTYVCKDKCRIFIHNYPDDIIELAEKIGNSWQTFKKSDPIYKQVITQYDIHERTHGRGVVRAVLSFYNKANKPPPTFHQMQRMLHHIKYAVDPKYREIFSEKSIAWYDHGSMDNF